MFKVIPVRHNVFIFEGSGMCGKTFLAGKLQNVVCNDFCKKSHLRFHDEVNYVFTTNTPKNTEKILSTILESGYEIWDGKDTTAIKNSCQVGKFLHMYYEDEKRGNR